jgi:hypothetical protein
MQYRNALSAKTHAAPTPQEKATHSHDMKTIVFPTHRVHGIKRDTTLPQRIGYPVRLASRKPVSVYVLRDVMLAGSVAIVAAVCLVAWRLIIS